MKKKIDSIIFDLDGTIIDSGPDLLDSLNFVLKKKNYLQLEMGLSAILLEVVLLQ